MKRLLKTTLVTAVFLTALFNIHLDYSNEGDTAQIVFKSGNEALAFSGGLGFAREWEGSTVNYEYNILTGCLTTTTTFYDMRTCHNSQTLCHTWQRETHTTTDVDCVDEIAPGGL